MAKNDDNSKRSNNLVEGVKKMRKTLKLALILMAVVVTGCNEEFKAAMLSGAGTVITDAVNALIASLIPTAG